MTLFSTRPVRTSALLLLGLLFVILVTGALAQPDNGSSTIFLPAITGSGTPPSDLLLGDGGVVKGIDGLTIGAVKGALSESHELSLARAALPGLPIPGGAQPHGEAYAVTSLTGDAYTRGAITFILGLPLPTGAPQDNLGIALYKPADEEGPEDWFFLPALVDSAHNLLLATFPHLSTAGYTAVIVEHPALQSPLNNPALADRAGNRPTSPAATSFHVICVIEDEGIRENCEIDKDVVEGQFQDYMADFMGMGYPEPLLYTQAEAFNIDNPTVSESNSYVVTINTACRGQEGKWNGFYLLALQQLTLCRIPNAPLPNDYLQTMRHELFHATQFAYTAAWADWVSKSSEKWVFEGVATTSEESDLFVTRRDPSRALHYVDRSLKSDEDFDQYKAQDFWVFLAQQPPGSGLGRFTTLFEKGANTSAVIEFIGSEEGLRGQYWRWAKNHVMVEESIDYDKVLGRPCQLQAKVLEESRTVDLYNEGRYTGSLPPLTSHVVKLIIDPELEGLGRIGVWVNNPFQDDPDLRYKVYVNGETCTSIPDGFRYLYDLTAAKDYYVLVSNTSPSKTRDYSIAFD